MNSCPGQINACAMRVSRLEPNGVPDPGADNLIVSAGLASMSFTPVYAEGEEIEVKNACGDICIAYKAPARLKRIDLVLDLCQLDPELFEMLAGGGVLTDGDAVGYEAPDVGEDPTPYGVSMELWAQRIIDGELDPDFPYEWWVFPRTRWRFNERTFNNGPMSHPLSGEGTQNTNWYDGPLNDWPLPPADRLWQHIPTSGVPTTSCGYGVLSAS